MEQPCGISITFLTTKLKIGLSESIFVSVSKIICDSWDKKSSFCRDGSCQG